MSDSLDPAPGGELHWRDGSAELGFAVDAPPVKPPGHKRPISVDHGWLHLRSTDGHWRLEAVSLHGVQLRADGQRSNRNAAFSWGAPLTAGAGVPQWLINRVEGLLVELNAVQSFKNS